MILLWPDELAWINVAIHLVNGAGVFALQAVALVALDWDAP